jgi:hypothetical protein
MPTDLQVISQAVQAPRNEVVGGLLLLHGHVDANAFGVQRLTLLVL